MLDKFFEKSEKVGDQLVEVFHLLGLFAIGGSIVWSAMYKYVELVHQGYASLDDILLLFIYLEMGAMVGIYFKTHRLPVIFLLYIAITALTRFLAIDLKMLDSTAMLFLTIAILILTVAVFILRASNNYFDDCKDDLFGVSSNQQKSGR